MSRVPVELFKSFFCYFFELLPFAFFQVIALCKFGHQKLVIKISQTISASSLRFGQLKEDGE